jgi:hypothetical protein
LTFVLSLYYILINNTDRIGMGPTLIFETRLAGQDIGCV